MTERSTPHALVGLHRALIWAASFAFACGVFLSLTLLLRNLPPTEPVAVGRVTVERISKLRDYVVAALFMLTVPPLAVWIHGLFTRWHERLIRDIRRASHHDLGTLATVFFTVPLLLPPLFFLTTGKVGWILLLPLACAWAGPRLILLLARKRWLRNLFREELLPFHGAIVLEAVSWIVFRYIATGRRIAHYPTLFLELVFIAFFVAIFWSVLVFAARLATVLRGGDEAILLQRLAAAGLIFVTLPPMAIALVSPAVAMIGVLAVFGLTAAIALTGVERVDARRLRSFLTFVLVPLLLYWVSYASTAALSQWIDLFHRGETLGPASDYLRGKAPYRDVFVLHGLLENGMLDAWLMQVFGRSLDVAIARPVILGSFLAPAIYFLGLAIFDSIPLALLCVAMGSWTTAENHRTLFQVAIVALLWAGLSRRRPWFAVAAGVMAGVMLFFSYDIGLYSIVGGIVSIVAIAVLARRIEWSGLLPARAALLFLAGVVGGALPFVFYLMSRGVFGAFIETTFVTVPSIIDAVWSLPFPDLVTPFRKNLSLHTLSEFILFEKFHLVLSFLVIAVALVYVLQRWVTRRLDSFDLALLTVTIFAAISQRSALGRAEFRHQYFAAFLVGPIVVMLGVLFGRRLREHWRQTDHGGRAFLSIAVAAMIAAGAVLLWVPDLVGARLDELIRYRNRIYRTPVDPAAEKVLSRIHQVVYEIHQVTSAGEPIFDFSNQPALYFFADRPNPTRFYQVPILSPKRFQAETITALEKAKPKVVIRKSPEGFDTFDGISNDIRAQAVAAYIDDHYRFWRMARGVEIWVRVPKTAAASLDVYLKRIHVPTTKEINEFGALARLIFPAVGSVQGANQTYWRSDLVIHNPFKEPMDLRLRYVAGDIRIDRPLRLRSGQIVRWDDVVRTLFFAPGTRGVLYIEHRAWRTPVTRVRTYDSAHASKGSLDSPLSLRDAASAYATLNDLTIVGIPSDRVGRRVNVGIVNVGDIPATFEISARTKNGDRVGGVITQGLPEDESFLEPDVERALGMSIDESMTLHVKMIAGSCVAYATTIDPENGDHLFIPAVPSLQP